MIARRWRGRKAFSLIDYCCVCLAYVSFSGTFVFRCVCDMICAVPSLSGGGTIRIALVMCCCICQTGGAEGDDLLNGGNSGNGDNSGKQMSPRLLWFARAIYRCMVDELHLLADAKSTVQCRDIVQLVQCRVWWEPMIVSWWLMLHNSSKLLTGLVHLHCSTFPLDRKFPWELRSISVIECHFPVSISPHNLKNHRYCVWSTKQEK